MPEKDDLVLSIRDLCFGTSEQTRVLLNTGEFSPGWVKRYEELLLRAQSEYRDAEQLPHALAAALYITSVYCTKRYADWKGSTSRTNPETEHLLQEVRWAADRLLLARYCSRPTSE